MKDLTHIMNHYSTHRVVGCDLETSQPSSNKDGREASLQADGFPLP